MRLRTKSIGAVVVAIAKPATTLAQKWSDTPFSPPPSPHGLAVLANHFFTLLYVPRLVAPSTTARVTVVRTPSQNPRRPRAAKI